jgi:hypothetical protein
MPSWLFKGATSHCEVKSQDGKCHLPSNVDSQLLILILPSMGNSNVKCEALFRTFGPKMASKQQQRRGYAV